MEVQRATNLIVIASLCFIIYQIMGIELYIVPGVFFIIAASLDIIGTYYPRWRNEKAVQVMILVNAIVLLIFTILTFFNLD